jgi:hypothetical protein
MTYAPEGLQIYCIALLCHLLLNWSAGFQLAEITARRAADLKSKFSNLCGARCLYAIFSIV